MAEKITVARPYAKAVFELAREHDAYAGLVRVALAGGTRSQPIPASMRCWANPAWTTASWQTR